MRMFYKLVFLLIAPVFSDDKEYIVEVKTEYRDNILNDYEKFISTHLNFPSFTGFILENLDEDTVNLLRKDENIIDIHLSTEVYYDKPVEITKALRGSYPIEDEVNIFNYWYDVSHYQDTPWNLDRVNDKLNNNELAGAILDVFTHEPLDKSSRLWHTPNLILTPHVSSDDNGDYVRLTLNIFIKNLKLFIENKELINQIDKKLGY